MYQENLQDPDAKFLVHVFCSGESRVRNGLVELKLIDDRFFKVGRKIRSIENDSNPFFWTVFDCGRNIIHNPLSAGVGSDDEFKSDDSGDESCASGNNIFTYAVHPGAQLLPHLNFPERLAA